MKCGLQRQGEDGGQEDKLLTTLRQPISPETLQTGSVKDPVLITLP